MLVSPEEYNPWTFLGHDFQMDAVFSSLLVSTVDTCFCQSSRRSREEIGFFLEDDFWIFPVFSSIWFDNGYMLVLSDKGVDMPVVVLDSLVQTVLGQVVDVPVVVQRQVRGSELQKTGKSAVAVHL